MNKGNETESKMPPPQVDNVPKKVDTSWMNKSNENTDNKPKSPPKKVDTSWMNKNNDDKDEVKPNAPPKKIDTSWMNKPAEEEKKGPLPTVKKLGGDPDWLKKKEEPKQPSTADKELGALKSAT